MTILYRRATTADLPAIDDLFYQNEVAGHPRPPLPRLFAFFRHTLAEGEMWIAEEGAAPLGFSGILTRDGIAYLTDLFVRADAQSDHIGKTLLRHTLPGAGAIRCTMASRDPRAVSLYAREGMRPQWPHYWLLAESARLRSLPATDMEVIPADANTPAFLQWDEDLCGRRRPGDIAYWLEAALAVPIWCQRAGETIGYGLVQTHSDASLWNSDAYTLGPIGARRGEDAAACVYAAVEWARERAAAIRLALPGPHPALAALLEAGFQITDVETFCSSAPEPFFDPSRYITSGEWL